MTEHSIEELERQLRVANGRLTEARNAVSAATARLKDAHLAATGLAGHLVKGRRRDTSPEYTILVEDIRGYRYDELRGRVLKKDGTLGVQTMDLPISRLADLGPYVDPQP